MNDKRKIIAARFMRITGNHSPSSNASANFRRCARIIKRTDFLQHTRMESISGFSCNNVHDTTARISAVKRRGAAGNKFDPIDERKRQKR